tara:strand:+ start:2576 stop:2842 length:267 start_codon:yes stop_codon:yes gene_type:complete
MTKKTKFTEFLEDIYINFLDYKEIVIELKYNKNFTEYRCQMQFVYIEEFEDYLDDIEECYTENLAKLNKDGSFTLIHDWYISEEAWND